jgi:hypothetical protein
MTKYFLNSGAVRHHPERAKKFFAEMVKELKGDPRFLVCLFAQPREDWEKKFSEYTDEFFPQGVKPIFDLAFPATFAEQIKKADVIYICGGDDHLIQYWLRKFDLPKIWEGKIIATSSASSNAMAKSFWTGDWRQGGDGLGILPIKFLAHYKSSYGADDPRGPIDWDKALAELKNYGDADLPIYALEEGDYVVIEK